MDVESPVIVEASGDQLIDANGRSYTDLFAGYGSVALGHAHPKLVAALQAQAEGAWLLGGLRHAAGERWQAALQPFLPSGFEQVALMNTGMESAELALRVARAHTGRPGAAGFNGSMHGKSVATSLLGWENGDGLRVQDWVRLPFGGGEQTSAVLAALDKALNSGAVGIVFLELMQGSNGAIEFPLELSLAIQKRTRTAGALLICDEILTGFHRTGPCFRFQHHGLQPDMFLIGKSLGNGFPVSGLVLREGLKLQPRMLPGSTFSSNPLACRVVTACLQELRALNAEARADAIGATVSAALTVTANSGHLRGGGALWVLDAQTPEHARSLARRCYANGVSVGLVGRWIRVMPALTIDLERLQIAIEKVAKAWAEEFTR